MRKGKKRARQILTLLLAVALFVGAVPVNAFAMSDMNAVMETTVEEDNLSGEVSADLEGTESTSDNDVVEESEAAVSEENFDENMEETTEEVTEETTEVAIVEETTEGEAVEEEAIEEETTEDVESMEESEEENLTQQPSVSEEQNVETVAAGEETEIQIDFVVEGVDDPSLVDVIQIVRKNDTIVDKVTLEDKVVTAVAGKYFEFELRTKNGYKVQSVAIGTEIDPVDGIYKIKLSKDGTVTVTLAELEEIDVTFVYNDEQIKNVTAFAGAESFVVKDKVPVKILEESNLIFEFKLESKVIVKSVTVNGEKVPKPEISKDGKSYRYTLEEPLKEALEIKIETSLDEKQCYIVDVAVIGHKNSVEIYYGDSNESYRHGDRILMTQEKNNNLFIYEEDEEYKITKVLFGEEELIGNEHRYTVNFLTEEKGIEGAKALVIYTEPKTSEDKKKVIFANSTNEVTYEVKINTVEEQETPEIVRDPLKKNTYTVMPKVAYMEFSVTYKKGYNAIVEIPAGVLYDLKVKETSTTYTETYSMVVSTLGDEEEPTIIKIGSYSPMRKISVLYDEDKIESLYAIVDGKYVDGVIGYDSVKQLETLNFEYPQDTELVFAVEAKDEYIINKIVESTKNAQSVETKPVKQAYTYTVKADQDKTIEIQFEGVYTAEIYHDSDKMEAQNGLYTVKGGEDYNVYLYKGEKVNNNIQIISKAVLKNGKTVLWEKAESNTTMKVPVPVKDAAGKSLDGKNLTLELTYLNNGKTQTYQEQLKVLLDTKITSISGSKNGQVSQTAGTVKEYALNSNLSEIENQFVAKVFTAETNAKGDEKIKLDNEANEKFEAEIVEDKLKIAVKTSDAGEKALIKIFEKGKEDGDAVEGGELLVTSKAPAFNQKTKPTVSLKNTTNLSVVLSLGMSNLEELGDEENTYAEYWYKIESTPKLPNNVNKTPEVSVYTESFTEYIKYKDASQIDSIQVVDRADSEKPDNTMDYEEGKFPYKTDHKIKVSLIQTTGPIAEDEVINESKIAFESKAVEINASTKTAAYETNLGLKTVKTSLYSGQKDVVVAYPVFSKATSYQDITAKVKWESSVEGALHDEIEVCVDEDNNIIFSAGTMAKAGKYVVEVTAESEEGSVPARKEFTVQVLQGIYQIDLEVPEKIYKAYKKAATLKVGIFYNEENNTEKEVIAVPKTKKVKWVLLDHNKEVIDEEHPDYDDYKAFTIKDGVVTIADSFIVSKNAEKNTFYVQAIAKDFERKENEEEIVGTSEAIVITNDKATLGELVLVKENEEDASKYDLIAASGYQVTVSDVQGSQLVMLKKGTIERDWYTQADFMEITQELEKQLEYSSSNKSVEIDENKIINVKNIASGVKLTAKMKDGSNVSTSLSNLKITYVDAEILGISVIQKGMTILDSYNNQAEEFYGSKDEALSIRIHKKDKNGVGIPIFGENYQLSIKGAKIIESDQLRGEYEIVGTGDTIVIQLDNKTTGSSKVFTLKNAALNNSQTNKVKALSLKTEGSLATGWFSKEKPQTITYTLPKESIGKYTHAYVTVDKLDYLDEKKQDNYRALITAALGSLGKVPQEGSLETVGVLYQLDSTGKIILTFGAQEGEDSYYIPEENFTYKLNIAFGTMTENYEFKAGAKPNAITIVTKKTSIANAKLNTSYNMSIKEGGEVLLALNNKKVELVSVGPLMNMNIKGSINRFAELFEIQGNVLKLKSKAKIEAAGFDYDELIANKNNLTGYISQYTYTDGNKEKTVYNTVVKINLKDVIQKYTLSSATVLTTDVKAASVDVDVTLFAGKNAVKAAYVYVPSDQKFEASVNDDGTLNFTSKTEKKLSASNKCTVYVVPESSYYVSLLDTLTDTELEKAITSKGIKLTASIAIKDQKKTSGKIKFASNDLKPVFTDEHFVYTDTINLEGVYQMIIPYTMAMEWEDEEGKEVAVNYSNSDVISISNVEGEEAVLVVIDKQELRKVCESKSKKDSYGNTYGYGKKVSVKVNATFGENTKEETIAFSITLPKQPLQLEQAVKLLNAYAWSDLEVITHGQDGALLDASNLVTENQPLVEEVAKSMLSKDGDLKFEIYSSEALPSKENEKGHIKYSAKLIDLGAQKTTTKYLNDISIEIDEILKQPQDFMNQDGEVEELLEAIAALDPIKNTTSITTILESIREYMGFDGEDSKYKHLRLYVQNVQRKNATVEYSGYIKGDFCITSVVDKDAETLVVPFELEIAQLMTFEQAKETVINALNNIKITHDDIKYNPEKAEEIQNAAKEALRKTEYNVYVPDAKLEYVDETRKQGKITLRISREGANGLEKEEFVYIFDISN